MEMERQEWRRLYREGRYLADLTDSGIGKWLDDLLDGATAFKPAGWDERITHVEEELTLRGKPLDPAREIRRRYRTPDEVLEDHRAFSAPVGVQPGECLIKYAKAVYLEQTLRDGLIRIAPASTYADPSLNSGCHDPEETAFRVFVPPGTELRVEIGGEYRTAGWLVAVAKHTADYFVLCASSVLSPRLLSVFEADACLVIHDWKRFVGALTENSPMPDCSVSADVVSYIDPFHPDSRLKEAAFAKHLRYAYQYEWRVAWQPQRPIKRLFPVFVRLGDLSSYCELLRFGNAPQFGQA
jgi:hypothetical protein